MQYSSILIFKILFRKYRCILNKYISCVNFQFYPKYMDKKQLSKQRLVSNYAVKKEFWLHESS